MEEFKNGIISEEALDEIAGGAGVSKDKLMKGLKIGGIVIGSAAAVATAFGVGHASGKRKGYDKGYELGTAKGHSEGYVDAIRVERNLEDAGGKSGGIGSLYGREFDDFGERLNQMFDEKK